MGKNLRRKCMLGGVILVLLFIVVAYAYFRVYTKTPEYAVKQVESAIETHDKTKFYRYVNMDSVLDLSYDAFVATLIGGEGCYRGFCAYDESTAHFELQNGY